VPQVWLVDVRDRSVEVCRGRGQSEIVRDVIRWRVPAIDMLASVDLADVFAGVSV
jgi:hypothetical protein